eukprot:363244-Chlamydomonas_euryale.AAC.6
MRQLRLEAVCMQLAAAGGAAAYGPGTKDQAIAWVSHARYLRLMTAGDPLQMSSKTSTSTGVWWRPGRRSFSRPSAFTVGPRLHPDCTVLCTLK